MVGSSTAHFHRQLRAYLSALSSCTSSQPSSRRTKLIYLPAPAPPPRTDRWPRDVGDRRTSARGRVWRDLTLELTRREEGEEGKDAGWAFVDQYDLTRSFDWEVLELDMGHYLATDALDPLVDDVLGKMGICG
jgi:hypothetical protein